MNKAITPPYLEQKPARQSNFELLRIVAMLLVLIVHADFFSIGSPKSEWLLEHPVSSMMRYVVESLALVCVNVYIIISGYFGIKVKKKSVLAFAFMVVFWRVLILVGYKIAPLLIDINTRQLSMMDTLKLCIPGYDDWFVSAYILLLFLAPILNDYIESQSPKGLWRFVWLFVGFQIIFSWLIPIYTQFSYGYSVLSFIGLYITGASIRKSPEYITQKIKRPTLWYLEITISIGVIMFLTARYCTIEHLKVKILSLFGAYNGLFVYISSVMLFLAFSRLRFQSKFINFVASSTFAVYLFHMHPLMRCYYSGICSYLYYNYGLISYLILISGFILIFFVISVVIDLIRRWLWNYFISIKLN